MIHSEKTASCRHLLAKLHNLQKQSAIYRHTYRIASLNRQTSQSTRNKRVHHVVLNTSTQRSVCVSIQVLLRTSDMCVQDSIPDVAETEEGQSVPPLTLTVLSVSVCEVRQMERETVAFELTQVQEKHDMRVYSSLFYYCGVLLYQQTGPIIIE